VNAALANQSRFDEMRDFFGDVGSGYAAGIWQQTPEDHPQYRERYKTQMTKQAAKRKAEEMG
jgi:chlorophyllide a reductase subunit Y